MRAAKARTGRPSQAADWLLTTRVGGTITVVVIIILTLGSLAIGPVTWFRVPADVLNFPLSAVPGFAGMAGAWWALILPGAIIIFGLNKLAAPATEERQQREDDERTAQQHGPHVAEDLRFSMLPCTGVHERNCALCAERIEGWSKRCRRFRHRDCRRPGCTCACHVELPT